MSTWRSGGWGQYGRWAAAGWAVASAVGAAVACGSNGPAAANTFPDGGHDGGSHGGSHEGGGGHEAGHLGSPDGDRAADGPNGLGDAGIDGACAAQTTPATVIPAYLVFVLDRSDSMKQYGKWPACTAALESFFTDPSTAGIYSSLTFMPYVAPDAADTMMEKGYSCTSSDYATPEVPITALPSAAFAPVIEAETLALGTPTTAALEGATTQAVSVKAAHPTAKVLIVLATDGYPAGCTMDSINAVARAAHAAAKTAGIPVYVIGVGPDDAGSQGIANLDQVAEAGTTGRAFFIPTNAADGGDAGITEQAFLAAVHSIQGTLGCRYSIPAAPAGQQLDYDKVNVVLSTGTTPTTLPYSASCSDTSGWYYEYADAGTPDDIVLCAASCKAARMASSTSSVSVALGCDTTGGTPPK